ncbi:SPOSA6832_01860 [Sporobolomyces salmonicolor]|uniref:Large ribosomal subunit protein bL21m n=1 Tax=Sporidiobolus salmonicolor TaxID=5005 RepID=A0A0D6EKX7_SPOSA|nr:SPOSA6832_01860 [Sporobolomyces salmonicolor]
MSATRTFGTCTQTILLDRLLTPWPPSSVDVAAVRPRFFHHKTPAELLLLDSLAPPLLQLCTSTCFLCPSSTTPAPCAPECSLVQASAGNLVLSPSHYVSALLMGRRYLLTPNDILTLPKLKNVPVGTRIALTRILEVGSRDYTLRAAAPASHPAAQVTAAKSAHLTANKTALTFRPPMTRNVAVDGTPKDWQRHPDSLPFLGEDVVRAELVVVEHTKGAMFEVEKFKKRKGYRRTLRSKLGFTKLRMGEIILGKP